MMEAVQGDVTKAMRNKHRALPEAGGVEFVTGPPPLGSRVTFPKSSVAKPVMATPTKMSARAKLRTKHQLWLLFLMSSFSKAAATTMLVEMMRQDAVLRTIPITRGFGLPPASRDLESILSEVTQV